MFVILTFMAREASENGYAFWLTKMIRCRS